jgi:hypothetical protein
MSSDETSAKRDRELRVIPAEEVPSGKTRLNVLADPYVVGASGILSGPRIRITKAGQILRGLKVYLIDEGLLALAKESGMSWNESLTKAEIEAFHEQMGKWNPVQVATELLGVVTSFVESDKRMKPTDEELAELKEKAATLTKALDKIQRSGTKSKK